MKIETSTSVTYVQCDHNTGWFMTAKILWFKKRYFVCSDCGTSMTEKFYKLISGN